ncbi:MAG: DNA polymerase III subunit beta [Elusimicrobia bacterium CG08_land_8_20_14_0_20_44_26]|nr:MAG: DNA polymerase III subunit beta [Elusimicrobia bacterium CG08_land_8_20_14_0_20_44_26]
MKFSCKKNELMKNVQTALLCLSPKTMLPYLSFILMEAEDNKVTITSTDLEVSMKITFNAKVEDKGKTMIHGDLFGALMRVQEEKDVTIEEGENSIIIKCGKFSASVPKGNLKDYPQIPDTMDAKDKKVELSALVLSDMLRKTVFSASRDEVRYVLCSEYFEVNEGRLVIAATDGKRLATTACKINVPKSYKSSAIVPIKTIGILQKILGYCEEKETVNIIFDENSVFFSTKNTVMNSRLIDGTYPDFRNVIPKSCTITVTMNREEIQNATIRSASIFQAGIAAQNSSVKYQINKNKLNISASSQGFGEAEEEVDITSTGGTVNIAFSPDYLIDVFKHLDDTKVNMELTDSLNAAVIKSPDDSEFISLIMPMRS